MLLKCKHVLHPTLEFKIVAYWLKDEIVCFYIFGMIARINELTNVTSMKITKINDEMISVSLNPKHETKEPI